MIIEESLYKTIHQILPITCVDIIVKNKVGKYLLVMRTNEPIKDEWWVVGGRVHHCETLEDAARRKLREEVGISSKNLTPVGYYEDVFDTNSMNVDAPYHTVSFVFETTLESVPNIILDEQSSEWVWADKLPMRFKVIPYSEN